MHVRTPKASPTSMSLANVRGFMYGIRVALRWKVLVVVSLFVLIFDQYTKFLAVKHLTPAFDRHAGASFADELKLFYAEISGPCRKPESVCVPTRVVDGFWNWRYVENPGAAWGILSGTNDKFRVPFFFAISIAAIIFILSLFRKLEDNQTLLIAALSLVFGGAIGNFVDRLHLNYVIDFIDWYVNTSHWPTFNLADAAISSGVALLFLEMLRERAKEKAGESAKAAS